MMVNFCDGENDDSGNDSYGVGNDDDAVVMMMILLVSIDAFVL